MHVNMRITRRAILMVLLVVGTVATALAQNNVRIGEPGPLDLRFMAAQRELVNELAARNFGVQFSGDRNADLQLLQRLLDKGAVRAQQTRELQAMGVIMGDLLAADLGMHWVIYEDREGRSRALRYRQTDEYLFPITMISRRREVGNMTPVAEIYQKAHDIIAPLRPDLPFQ